MLCLIRPARAVLFFPSKAGAVFNDIWDATVDSTRKYELKATTSFDQASQTSRLSLGHRGGFRGGGGGARGGYLPSQALLQSSLSQDVGFDDAAVGSFDPSAASSAHSRTSAADAAGAGGDVGASASASLASGSFATGSLASQGGAATSDDVQIKGEGHGGRGSGAAGGAGGDLGEDEGAVVLVQGYELDELSTHPLMGTLLRAIAELRKRDTEFNADCFCSPAKCAESHCPCGGVEAGAGMPIWMHALLLQMLRGESEPATSLNRRLIIARLAINLTQQEIQTARDNLAAAAAADTAGIGTPSSAPAASAAAVASAPTFERFAKLWARPLLRLVLDSLQGEGACFHYLARDLIHLVTGWQRTYVGSGRGDVLLMSGAGKEEADALLADLIEKLMGMCSSDDTLKDASSERELMRENVRIVKLLIEVERVPFPNAVPVLRSSGCCCCPPSLPSFHAELLLTSPLPPSCTAVLGIPPQVAAAHPATDARGLIQRERRLGAALSPGRHPAARRRISQRPWRL